MHHPRKPWEKEAGRLADLHLKLSPGKFSFDFLNASCCSGTGNWLEYLLPPTISSAGNILIQHEVKLKTTGPSSWLFPFPSFSNPLYTPSHLIPISSWRIPPDPAKYVLIDLFLPSHFLFYFKNCFFCQYSNAALCWQLYVYYFFLNNLLDFRNHDFDLTGPSPSLLTLSSPMHPHKIAIIQQIITLN